MREFPKGRSDDNPSTDNTLSAYIDIRQVSTNDAAGLNYGLVWASVIIIITN